MEFMNLYRLFHLMDGNALPSLAKSSGMQLKRLKGRQSLVALAILGASMFCLQTTPKGLTNLHGNHSCL